MVVNDYTYAISQIPEMWDLVLLSSTKASFKYVAKQRVNTFSAIASSGFYLYFAIHESKYGFHPTSVSLIYKTPPRDTVAGVAFLRLETSRISLISGVRGIRS